MKTLNLFSLFIVVLVFTSCQNSNKASDDNSTKGSETTMNNHKEEAANAVPVTIRLEPKSGSKLSGTAKFTETNGKVTLEATINGLSEGEHAIHIHEKGECNSDDGTSAGGHWNPTNQPHGKWGDSKGYHKGDIGNFKVDDKGVGRVDFSTDEWCIGCNDPQKDIMGKALIIHDGVDDFTSQPAGAAGIRVGCGVIKR